MKDVRLGLALAVLLFCGSSAFAGAARTFYSASKWNTTGNQSFGLASTDAWVDENGEPVLWNNDGGTAAVLNGLPYNMGVGAGDYLMYGLVVDKKNTSSAKCLFDSSGVFCIGEGGLDSRVGSIWFSNGSNVKVRLTANQTWTGGTTDMTHVGIGRTVSSGAQAYTRIEPSPDVTTWNIEGKLCVWLMSPSNDFSGVDVTVKAPAKLFLLDDQDGRLHARKLTLEGDGESLPLGKSTTYTDWSNVARNTVASLDTNHLAPMLELKDGADVSVSVPVAFDIPDVLATGVADSRSEISGPLVFANDRTAVDVAAGVTLAFTGPLASAEGVSAGVSLTGGGTLEMPTGLPGPLEIGESSRLVLTGAGRLNSSVSGGGVLEIASSDVAQLGGCDLSDYVGERIVVSSGSLELGSMADLAAGVRISTSGDAKVLFGTTEGFDEDRLEGTKNYEFLSPLVVTDTVRTEETLTLNEGETLHIRGNGLTSETALVLNGGTVCFEMPDVTIGSPVTVQAPVKIETTGASVTGRVTGAVSAVIPSTAASTSGISVSGAGCVVLAGGGTFANARNNVTVKGGASLLLTNGDYSFASATLATSADTTDWGRYIGIVDGGHVTFTGNERSAIILQAKLDDSAYNKTAVLEVGSGSSCELRGNLHLAMGSDQAQGKLIVSGGTMKIGGVLLLGYISMGTAVIELRDGVLELSNAMRRFRSGINSYQAQGRFDWSGGTLKVASDYPASELYLIRNASTAEDELKRLRVWTRIMGDCTLDLTSLPARETPLANVPAGFDRAEWFGKGTLTVKGGKSFVMNSIGDGVGLRLEGDGTQVILPEDAQVFDYDVCAANMDVVPYKDRYSTTNTVLLNLSLPTFIAAGKGVSLSNDCPTRTISIAEASASAGGCFDNADTLVGVGPYVVTNLTFAEGSVLGAKAGALPFAVIGTLTLPSSLGYFVRRGISGAANRAAFAAAGGLVGDPVWNKVDGSLSRSPRLDATEGEVWFDQLGLILLFK